MAEQTGAPPPLPGQPPPPPAQTDLAMRQAHQDTRTYPCGTCGGELVFHIGQQQLACPHCGNQQQLREVSGTVEEKDLEAALADLRGRKMAGGDAGALALVGGEKEVVCQNCGGHTTFTGTLTATKCPYCTTPIQRDDVHAAPERLPVDGVLPFQVDEATAKAKLEEWISSRWFAPSEFKDYSRAGSFASVYTAYFTYDAQASTSYTGERGDDYTVTVGSGEDQRTETRTRWSDVRGTVSDTFDDVAILANSGAIDVGKIEALEPWPTDQLRPFSQEYVAGHLSRTYDRDVEVCFADAKSRMESVIQQTIRRDIGGDHQRIRSSTTRWSGLTFKHVLLPIWLLTVTYDGRPFQVMINGVTGEVVGDRPYSKVKIAAAVLLAIVIAVVLWLVFAG